MNEPIVISDDEQSIALPQEKVEICASQEQESIDVSEKFRS
jgi:hypothetical protein